MTCFLFLHYLSAWLTCKFCEYGAISVLFTPVPITVPSIEQVLNKCVKWINLRVGLTSWTHTINHVHSFIILKPKVTLPPGQSVFRNCIREKDLLPYTCSQSWSTYKNTREHSWVCYFPGSFPDMGSHHKYSFHHLGVSPALLPHLRVLPAHLNWAT